MPYQDQEGRRRFTQEKGENKDRQGYEIPEEVRAMKFITESVQNGIEYLVENTVKGKRVYIEGPFMMANAVNRNGRFYPKEVLEAAVDQYLNDYVNQNRATGELNHPDYPFPDPKKAAIFIESLYWQGDNVIGKAKVLNIGDGLVIQELLEAGFKLGVSTRGLGDLKARPDGSKEVYKYAVHAVDAVDFPSGQTCYVKPHIKIHPVNNR
jgi:hypothetical protein